MGNGTPLTRSKELIADRFEVQRIAGSGGMGYVYRALDRATGQPVALKLLRDLGDDHHVRRFLREVELQASLHHPGIVRYVAHGISHGTVSEPFLALEWLDGETLSSYLGRQSPTIRQSIALARRVAEALGFVHRRTVVHRDIKPGNLFLVGGDPEGVKILDFGIARVDGSDMTRAGAMLGTMRYMAPEQLDGRSPAAPADVFALGVVLYECLTGKAPFDDSAGELRRRIQLEPIPSVREKRPEVPLEIARLVEAMVEPHVEKRLPDGDAVVRAIDALGDTNWDTIEPLAREGSITAVEQRVVSLMLAMISDDAAQADAPTIATTGDLKSMAPSPELLAQLAQIAQRHGARGEELRDGTFLIVPPSLGAPSRHLDVVAECALEVHALLPRQPIVVVTGRGRQTELAVFGSVLERAGRFLGETAPGRVRLDEASLALLDARFRLDDTGTGLVSVRARDATLASWRTPFLGRKRELRALTGLVEEASDEGHGGVAVVTGAAGAGKSRLVAELLNAVRDDVTTLGVTCDPVRAGSAFGTLASLVAHACGAPEALPPVERRARLRAYLDGLLGAEAASTALFLAEVIRAPYDDEVDQALRAARVSGELMQQRVRAAVLAWLGAVAQRGPTLVVIEDLQWADAPSVDLLDTALRHLAEQPLVLVGTGRPELERVFPDLWKRRAPQTVVLDRLPDKIATQLATELLGPDLGASVVERVVERAGGNPYLLEEIARAVRAGWRADGDTTGNRTLLEALPDSVLGLVQATMDDLEPSERLVLRAASVFGQHFWREGALALVPPAVARDLDGWLETLERREIIERRTPSSLAGAVELRIRQELVRAAAYGTLTDEDRELGHRIAGEWLEAHGETDPMVLANHFDRGRRPERAARRYLAAAINARAGGDIKGALAALTSAIACQPGGELLGEIHGVAAALENFSMRFEEARTHGHAAMEVLRPGSALWFLAAGEVTNSITRLGDNAGLEQIGRMLVEAPLEPQARSARAFAVACTARALLGWELFDGSLSALLRLLDPAFDAQLDAYPMPRVHELRARLHERRKNPAGLVEELRLGIAAAERVADMQQAVQLKSHMGVALREIGASEEALAVLSECYAPLGEEQKLLRTYVDLHIGLAYMDLGRHEEGWQRMQEGVVGVQAMGTRYRAIAGAGAARMRLLVGDLDEAEKFATRALVDAARLVSWRVPLLAIIAAVRLARGDTAAAHAAVLEYYDVLERPDVHVFHEAFVWQTTARVLDAAGDEVRLLSLLAIVIRELATRAAEFQRDDERARYLGIHEHVALRAMGAARGIIPT